MEWQYKYHVEFVPVFETFVFAHLNLIVGCKDQFIMLNVFSCLQVKTEG